MSWQLGTLALLMLVLGAGMFWYERSRPPSQIVALVAVLAALAVAGRILLAPIPNVVATTDIVFFAGYALGPAPGFAVGALGGLISNFWLGQGVWTPWQMVGWGVTGIAGGIFWHLTRGRSNRYTLALACGLAGLAFGAWMNFQSMVSFGGEISLERYLALEARSIPFDIAHISGNVIFALAAGPAMVAALRRFRERFEWSRVTPVAGFLLMAVSLGAVLIAPPAEAAPTAAAQQARNWLVGQQNGDGGFPVTPDGESSPRITSRAMIGLASVKLNPLDVRKGGNTPLDYLVASKKEINEAGEIALAVLALKTVGSDPRDFAGRNLVKGLKNRSGSNGSFGNDVNVSAWSVLALRSAGAGDAASRTADWLRGAQNSSGDGGWGIASGAESDPDSTGTSLMAIGGSEAVRMAIEYLEGAQKSSGGFVSGSVVNSQSTTLVQQGLAARGKGPRFLTRNGNSPTDYLEARQQENGSIWYSKTSDQTRVWVTADSIVGLSGRSLPVGEPPRESEKQPNSGGSGGASPGSGSESGGSGSSGSSGGGSTGSFDPGPSSLNGGSGADSPTTNADGGSGGTAAAGTNGGSAGGEAGSGGDSGGAVPGTGVPVVPVVPAEALLAASRAGSEPSPVLAFLICLLVSGGLAGGTVLLVRKQGW